MYSRIVIPANAGIQGLNLNQQFPPFPQSLPWRRPGVQGWGGGEKYEYLPL